MATIFRGQTRDEGRLPEGGETVLVADGGDTTVERIDEENTPIAVERDVVRIEIAHGVSDARHIDAVVAVVQLALREPVGELPELPARGCEEPIGGGGQSHRPIEVTLEDGERPVGLQSDEEEAVGLIGGERQAQRRVVQPGEKVSRS